MGGVGCGEARAPRSGLGARGCGRGGERAAGLERSIEPAQRRQLAHTTNLEEGLPPSAVSAL